MNCIIKRPFEPIGRIREISNTLEALQKAVMARLGYFNAGPEGKEAGVTLAKLRIKANKIRRGIEK